MIKFVSRTIPKEINIEYFYNRIGYVECFDEFGNHIYVYAGSIIGAIDFLKSIGFNEVEIIEEISLTTDYFLKKRNNSEDF